MRKLARISQWFRILFYKLVSTNRNIDGKPRLFQPVQINGKGSVKFGDRFQIGVVNSPQFFNTYAYIEARKESAFINIGNNVSINNNFCAVANESSITIGDHTVIGINCQIYDCNFHNLDPEKRNDSGESLPVLIGKNVFIGSNVIILKGAVIEDNAVVGAGQVVKKNVYCKKQF